MIHPENNGPALFTPRLVPWRFSLARIGWWLSPISIALSIWVLLARAAGALPAHRFIALYGSPKYVDQNFVGTTYVAAAAFAIGVLASYQVARWRGEPRNPEWLVAPRFRRWIFRFYGLGVAASVVAAGVRLGGPGPLVGAIASVASGSRGSTDVLRDAFEPVPGLTSLTQLGILIAITEGLVLTRAGGRHLRGASTRRLTAILVWSSFRAVFVSERLALVEVAVPLALVLLRSQRIRNLRRVALTALAPALAVIGLVAFFAATEYFRSYQANMAESESLVEYSENRLVGYYATAFNNGALYAEVGDKREPFSMIADGVLSFPGARMVFGVDERSPDLLALYANPEFNNVSPVGQLLLEGSHVYIALTMIAFGVIAGVAHAGYRSGTAAGVAWYCIIFVAMIEFPRIWYLTNQRLSAVALVALVGWLRYRHPRRPTRPTQVAAVSSRDHDD